MEIVIVGSGNVAYSLSRAISKAEDLNIVEICSRSREQGKAIALSIGSGYNSSIKNIAKADVYIVAVSDSATEQVVRQINESVTHDCLICHTSAMMPVLDGDRFGRLYPLQTFTAGRESDFSKITFFIETNSSKKEQILITLCTRLNSNIELSGGDKLRRVHLAATFANNFSNRMYHYAEQILKNENISKEVLFALIDESIEKLKRSNLSAKELQTGAAARKDD
ncbi:MAG: DUF2520 domain-containing protein, partial [Rikenellaceae bacterium]